MAGSIPHLIWLYRITHRDNLPHILHHGICNKNHPDANPEYVPIGHKDIIGKRKDHPVKIEGYGNIGDYVPFYFTHNSIMLYNILTGYGVPKLAPENIIFITATLSNIVTCGHRYFFTDGQANTHISNHLHELADLDQIDWDVIQSGDFRKTITDIDRPRRYQAEFLVHGHLPVNYIETIAVYNDSSATFVKQELEKTGILIPVYIKKYFYFNY
jgi:ssDNA thymidine ADP-ribosyltransferase, DarT